MQSTPPHSGAGVSIHHNWGESLLEFDAFVLARMQFAANITFHILFPSISIGLAWVLFYFRARFTLSGDRAWEYAYYFWVKVFALTFAMGVVSGITMSFQFGTNWPGFMERAGNVAGPLLGYEVLTAFFLEASFLGIMLFGKDRVSNRMHLISSFLVAFGTLLSAFWILSLNSWMQTPSGFSMENGRVMVDSWWAVIFNPSFPYRFIHMTLASFLTTAFLITGVSAWRRRKKVDGPATWHVMKTGIVIAAVLAPLQILVGDIHGLNTLEHQPAKIAAMEAIWETEKGAPFTVFGLPDEESRETRFALKIPYAASWILTHELDGEGRGLGCLACLARPGARSGLVAGTVVDDFFRLGCGGSRLVCDRDRPSALDRRWRAAYCGCGGGPRLRDAHGDSVGLCRTLCLSPDGLYRRLALSG